MSLVLLACSSLFQSRWSFGEHNVEAVSKLLKLKYPQMSVNEQDMMTLGETPVHAVLVRESTLLKSLLTVAQHLFLSTAALLPALDYLVMLPAFEGSLNHQYKVKRAFESAMESFISNLAPSTMPIVLSPHLLAFYKPSSVDSRDWREDSRPNVLSAYRVLPRDEDEQHRAHFLHCSE
ncbi:hypothetical protein B0H17DRAFT_1082219 [Mycena rosella]|uniref:Uncharacterized protein n=1 Tax=Mycena rosella TaxID=1033263 RepID=A0AAD7G7E7_MYCRO|nr:hypothetical protein B0H17DRAFT_1082219 [Mycena rosella]